MGGLKIESLVAKNLAFLAKWWWRIRLEKDKLWARVIPFIYGEDGGLRSSFLHDSRGIWPDIIHASQIIEGTGFDFLNSFRKSVGRGNATIFWHDSWAGDLPLSRRFCRLLALDLSK